MSTVVSQKSHLLQYGCLCSGFVLQCVSNFKNSISGLVQLYNCCGDGPGCVPWCAGGPVNCPDIIHWSRCGISSKYAGGC